jgi:hypothetical protein
MSDFKNSLESWVVEQLLPIDSRARRTRGSGCGNEIGDVSNAYFYVECKQKHTHENIIIEFKKEYQHLLFKVPTTSNKIVIMVNENKYGEKFVTLKAEDFFKMSKELYER